MALNPALESFAGRRPDSRTGSRLVACEGPFANPVKRAGVLPQVAVNSPTMTEASVYMLDENTALMCRVSEGDETALRELIRAWQTPLINFFYRSLGSRAEAEDLAQIVFIKLHRASSKYRPEAKFSTYLFHIARRVLLNELRRLRRKPSDATDPADFFDKPGGDMRRELKISEIEEMFHRALQKMPENHRTAILLLKQQELSYEEIAQSMQTSASVVKTWIFRAREQLREELRHARE